MPISFSKIPLALIASRYGLRHLEARTWPVSQDPCSSVLEPHTRPSGMVILGSATMRTFWYCKRACGVLDLCVSSRHHMNSDECFAYTYAPEESGFKPVPVRVCIFTWVDVEDTYINFSNFDETEGHINKLWVCSASSSRKTH